MELGEYDAMSRIEESMWWYRSLHENLLLAIRRQVTGENPRLLDAGCGTGGFLSRLEQAIPGASCHGVDISEYACASAGAKVGCPISVSSIDQLPFADNSFDGVISADVLYHTRVDEPAAIREAFRCLRSGGFYWLNLPAYQWLYSQHDVLVHTRRRYTKSRIRAALEPAGFRILDMTYWNTILFPLMVLRRKVLPGKSGESDVASFTGPVNDLFLALTGLERLVLRAGLSLPFGGSLLITAQKP